MRYRTKVLVIILSLIAVTTVIGETILDWEAENELLYQYRAKALSIAATAAAAIDGEDIKALNNPADEGTPAYERVSRLLREIRNRNRREDTWVAYVSTIYKDAAQPGIIRFGVDAEESIENHSKPGDIYKRKGGLPIDVNVAYVDEEPVSDQWGTWLTAHAPVRDRTGKVVGAVLVDIPYERVEGHLGNIWQSASIALVAAFGLGTLGALFLSRKATKPLSEIAHACSEIGRGNFEPSIDIKGKDEFADVAQALTAMAAGLKERETVKSAFARYVSKEVLGQIVESGEGPQIRGDRRRITVLFSDIRGFTTLSEKMRPEDVVKFLNVYFERMVDVIFAHKGTLDKFIGDGMMVLFGAPAEDPNHEENAVTAAIAMRREIEKLREEFKASGLPDIHIGIGIHTGHAVVGNIGSSRRLEYTAIGDTVNIAARLESASKELSSDIIISQSTAQALTGIVALKPMGRVKVKGKESEIEVATVA